MLACLKRAKEAGNTFFPEQSRIWVFPAETGHVAEVKEDGKVKLSHTGHALRHSFRTLAGGCRHRSAAAEDPDEPRASSAT